jgi:hypothetical protein
LAWLVLLGRYHSETCGVIEICIDVSAVTRAVEEVEELGSEFDVCRLGDSGSL